MKLKCHDGELHDVYLEQLEDPWLSKEPVREPTKEEVTDFFNREDCECCNTNNRLVYYTDLFLYESVNCAVCGRELGLV